MKVYTPLLVTSLCIFVACDTESIPSPSKEIQIDYYVTSFQLQDEGYQPQTKVQYQYDDEGIVKGYTSFTYNFETEEFDEQRSYAFSYADKRLVKIEGTLTGEETPNIAYEYAYNDSQLASITERYLNTSAVNTAAFSYAGDTVTVTYTYSNGNVSAFIFNDRDSNIGENLTKRGGQICSSGTYGYDQNLNPFHQLGYTDFFLHNYSVNNKVWENISYVGCSFPEFVPQFYEYNYNDDRYPVSVTTIYKSAGNTPPKSKREFFYR